MTRARLHAMRTRGVDERLAAFIAVAVALFLALLAAALLPARAHAQLAPDAPRLISPHGSGGLGFHWVRTEAFPDDDGALLVTWAMPALPTGMRLRGGVGRGAGGANAVMGGIDFQVPLHRGPKRAWTLDLDWQSGLGFSAGDYSILTLPAGLSGSASWSAGQVWVAPFLTAGATADLRLGDEAPEKEFRVDPTAEVGLDLAFDAARRVVLRAAHVWGERQSVSLGVAVRPTRR